MPTIGNHDDGPVDGDGAVYNQVFHLPRNTVTNTEDFYWFTAGNAIVVSLSSQTYEGGGMGSQAAWLDQVLTDNPRLWKFVFFHHPVYTSSSLLGLLDVSHPPNEVDQNAALTPVFDKHHVDFVFYGHNHFYERFQPMRGNGGDEEGIPVDDPEDGTYYVVSGGGGALTYNIAIGLFCGGAKGSAKCSGSHHFVRIEIERNRLKYTARATAQQLLNDNPGNSKDIESFTYEKAYPGGVDPCFTAPPEPGPEPVPEPIPEAPQEDAGVPVPDVADAPVPELPVAADLPATPDGSASPDVPTADLDRPDVPAPPPDQGSQADASATVPDTGTGASNPSSGGCGAAAFGGGPVAVSALVLLLGAGLRRRRHAG
jgi:uncharacterized protein (TIGR03382 family)